MAKQAGPQGFDLRTIGGAERADQEAILQRLAPVAWTALHPFRDHDIDLALQQLVQPRRLADADGDLWLGLAKSCQARPQPINGNTRVYPDMQQTCDALGLELGSGIGEATKRLTYPCQIGLPAEVRMTCRVRRSNSCTPSRSSSRRTCWLTAPAVTCSSWAACLKLRWRAAASKARRALSGGSRYVMAGSERR